MSFELRRTGERFELVLFAESPRAHPLAMGPTAMEPELASGRWLVLHAAIWSAPDRDAIAAALALARRAVGWQIGIRPFDRFEEIASWCPDARLTTATPVWLLLIDGALHEQREGLLDAAALAGWLAGRG